MNIQVIYVNGALGTASVQNLDDLINLNVIIGFRRSSGWVKVDKDELRSNRVGESGSWRDRKSNRQRMTM